MPRRSARKTNIIKRKDKPTYLVAKNLFEDRTAEAIDAYYKRAEKREEFKAQHGPVRQIMKDGKLL